MSVLPRNFFDEALHRDSELAQEAFDDGSTLCKLVLHFDVEDVCHQCNKGVFLQGGRSTDRHTLNVFNVTYDS